jgi:hypothetical protein
MVPSLIAVTNEWKEVRLNVSIVTYLYLFLIKNSLEKPKNHAEKVVEKEV